MTESQINLNIEGIVQAVMRQDALFIAKIKVRQTKVAQDVKSVAEEKQKKYACIVTTLAETEIQCDTVNTYVDDYLKDRTAAKKFDRKLKQFVKQLDEEPPPKTDTGPSKVKTGLLSANEMKVNYAKVLFKVESLQTLKNNALKEKLFGTTLTAAAPKRARKNHISPSLVSSLYATLEKILEFLNSTLKSTLTILVVIETKQNDLTDTAKKINIQNDKDFEEISRHHTYMYDWLDYLQTRVYDKTRSKITALEAENLTITRPAQVRNKRMPIKTFAEVYASYKKIEQRLYKIHNFCNGFLDDQMNNVVGMMWSTSLNSAAQVLAADAAMDFPEEAPGEAAATGPGGAIIGMVVDD